MVSILPGVVPTRERFIVSCLLAVSALPLSANASFAAHDELRTTLVSTSVQGPSAPLSFAMCLADGPRHIRVVETTDAGPSDPNAWTRTTATCPNRFVAVGGGARTDPPTAGGLKPIGSFPSDVAGNPVSSGATIPPPGPPSA